MSKVTNEQVKLAANTIRCLSADMIEKAKSGHPGAPMGMADIAASLWLKFLNIDPKEPNWANRDRLVFSGGHASALVYSLFHLSGLGNLTMDELKEFRQFGSRCAGHPERGLTPGVEVTTGPLGQGISMAVGLAIAERMSAARDNVDGEEPVVDHRTWCFCGDGDIEEGISHEACSYAGYLKLDRLILVYDSNNITIEGDTGLSMTDDTRLRFESYGWKVFECDGHDLDQIDRVYRKAIKVTGQPVIIIAKTTIGLGAPTKAGSCDSHGAPLGADEVAGAKKALGFDPEKSFYVPEEVYELFAERTAACHRMNLRWRKTFKTWAAAHPDKAAVRESAMKLSVPAELFSKTIEWDPSKPEATRSGSGKVMNELAPSLPFLVGGSADLGPSNKTYLKGMGEVAPGSFSGRNFHFGIRELSMTAIVNGITAYGGWRAYGATFFVFSDYCRPAIRLAALMGLPSIFVFSHDSFYVGEDGPTHEPVEHLAAMRTLLNVRTFRPADVNETLAAWLAILKNRKGPGCLLTTRQNVPVLEGVSREGVEKGGYTIYESSSHPDLIFISSGSEVCLCVEAAKRLAAEGKKVRVVSMPEFNLFSEQPLNYRESVIPGTVQKRVIVEAASRFGWQRYEANPATTRYVTLDTYGASAPYKVLQQQFGFTVENVLAKAREIL